MERIVEPELMNEREQAIAYAQADFEEPHGKVIELFESAFPGAEIKGHMLDLGCGPGDVTFRFARRFTEISIIAVDGSAAMIDLANRRKGDEGEAGKTITFLRGFIPGENIPQQIYDVIISTSFLHPFKPQEIEQQLACNGLAELSVKVVSDRHLIVFGEKS